MNDEVATMGDRLTTIYQGGYIPSLAIQLDPEHEWHGWLFFKHPDLQWVSLCKINRIEELEAELENYRDISDNSSGVVGWHLNGAVATWDELLAGEPGVQTDE